MKTHIKMILKGMPVRYLCEGAMSDIQIELMEWLEDLTQKVNSIGDFEVGNSINPNAQNLRQELDNFVAELDKYELKAGEFLNNLLKENPNITYLEVLKKLQEEFL